MTLKQHSIFWALAMIAFLLFLNIFSSIMLPFITGMAIAYFLDPVADKLEEWGLNRILATSIIMIVFILAFIPVVFLIIIQFDQLIKELPSLIDRLQNFVETTGQKWFGELYTKYFVESNVISDQAGNIAGKLASISTTLIAGIWSGGMAFFSFLSLLVVTPVVAFYLLNDWDRMTAIVRSWVPVNHKTTVFRLTGEMSKALSGFIRGQGSVCLILAVYYAATLSLVGLNFGLVVGIIAGIISFIPFVGAIVGLILSVGLALIQFWPEGDYFSIGIVAAIFVVGQFLEGNVLTPRLVGRHIGLHPVWLMFALFAFGTLFGFVGMLIAVPVAAMIGVLSRFAIEQYLKSPIYLGLPAKIEDAEQGELNLLDDVKDE